MARCLIVAVCMSCYHYDMDEKDFALRLAQLREKKNVSAREMSLAIGQNPGYINNIESGKSLPSLPGVFYICDYLGILEEELHTVIANFRFWDLCLPVQPVRLLIIRTEIDYIFLILYRILHGLIRPAAV